MFRESFKYYKSKKPLPDFSSVLNLSNISGDVNKMVIKIEPNNLSFDATLGVFPASEWEIYQIKSVSGLIFIRNPFTPIGQRYWITKCLKDYTKKPQKLNIDGFNLIKDDCDWWSFCCQENEINKNSVTKKLRWATLGYHHNWDTKVYSETNKDDFPPELACLSKYIAEAVGYENFSAEAAIVNFYHMDSTLSGHTDHSEDNLEAPLLSCSFGQSAIFLIGGVTEDCPATAMYIHSGDIVIMSKESRLCYHAVPRITRAPYQTWNISNEDLDNISTSDLFKDLKDEQCWKPFDNYVNNSRININIRQVLNKGQNKLDR